MAATPRAQPLGSVPIPPPWACAAPSCPWWARLHSWATGSSPLCHPSRPPGWNGAPPVWPLGFSGAASAASLTLHHHHLSLLLSHPCSYSSCHRTDPAEPPPWMRARDGGRRTTDTRGQFLPPLQPPWLESDSGPSPRRESRLGLRGAGLRPGTVPQVGSGRGLALSKPQPLAALLGGMLGGRGRVLWEGGSSCSLRSGGSSHDSILSRWPGTHGTLPAACVLISPPFPQRVVTLSTRTASAWHRGGVSG